MKIAFLLCLVLLSALILPSSYAGDYKPSGLRRVVVKRRELYKQAAAPVNKDDDANQDPGV